MPRKFRKVVRKGYYKKQVVEHVPTDAPDGSDEEDLGHTNKLTDVSTQTDYLLEVFKVDVSTQTNVNVEVSKLDMETQTDIDLEPMLHEVSKLDMETQTDGDHNLMVPANAMEINSNYVMCEGNDSERFQPLIIKHKGVFKDSTGT